MVREMFWRASGHGQDGRGTLPTQSIAFAIQDPRQGGGVPWPSGSMVMVSATRAEQFAALNPNGRLEQHQLLIDFIASLTVHCRF